MTGKIGPWIYLHMCRHSWKASWMRQFKRKNNKVESLKLHRKSQSFIFFSFYSTIFTSFLISHSILVEKQQQRAKNFIHKAKSWSYIIWHSNFACRYCVSIYKTCKFSSYLRICETKASQCGYWTKMPTHYLVPIYLSVLFIAVDPLTKWTDNLL